MDEEGHGLITKDQFRSIVSSRMSKKNNKFDKDEVRRGEERSEVTSWLCQRQRNELNKSGGCVRGWKYMMISGGMYHYEGCS